MFEIPALFCHLGNPRQDCCSLSDLYTLPLYPLSIVKKVMFPCYIFSVYNSSLKWQELYALFIVYFTESHNYTDNNGRLSDLGFAVLLTYLFGINTYLEFFVNIFGRYSNILLAILETYRAWTSSLCLNRRTRLLPYKLNLHLFFHKVKYD